MTNIEYFNELAERATHCDTMRPLSPLEAQQLEDYEAHIMALTPAEFFVWQTIEIETD